MIENLENYEDAVPVKTVFEYTFDGEKPATRTETDLTNNTITTVKYNDGRVYDYDMKHLNSSSTEKQMYQYGNGGEYFTMVLHDDFMSGEGYTPDVMKEEMDSVSVTTENGLLKRTTNTGIYTKWSEGEEKNWVRFRGIYPPIMTTTVSSASCPRCIRIRDMKSRENLRLKRKTERSPRSPDTRQAAASGSLMNNMFSSITIPRSASQDTQQ